MNFTDWINTKLPEIASELGIEEKGKREITADDGLDLTGRNDIYEILDDILAVLFPGSYSKERITPDDIQFFLSDLLRHISFRLNKHLLSVFRYRCKKENCDQCDCEQRSGDALMQCIESIPHIKKLLMLDIQAAFDGDPAAQSKDEIILSYPCIEAIAIYRIAHLLYRLDVPIIPRIMSERAHSRTGIDINPGATIGTHFFIDHGTGVVIGETCHIGDHVKIYQGVTLGALSPFDKEGNLLKNRKRHPTIENNVIIYANATILGGKTVIGEGAIVGGNTWITESVPPGSHIYNRDHIEKLKQRKSAGC